MDDIVKSFYDPKNDAFGLPQEFRNIKWYPIKLIDTKLQKLFYSVMQYPQKFIKDERIANISYLKFLTEVVQYSVNPSGREITNQLKELLEFITKEKVEFVYGINNEIDGDYLDKLVITIQIGNEKFSESDFNVIREIILLQQGLSTRFIESFDPVLEEMLNYENSKTEELTFDEEIFKFCSLMRCTADKIGDYTLYQFKRHFQQQILLFQYDTYAPLEISGQISAKNGRKLVKPYFTHDSDRGRYGNILIPLDEFFDDHRDPDMVNEKGENTMNLNNGKD